jgi:hypothetical protein
VNVCSGTSHTVAVRHILLQHITHCCSTSHTVAALHILLHLVTHCCSTSCTVAARHPMLHLVTHCCSTSRTGPLCFNSLIFFYFNSLFPCQSVCQYIYILVDINMHLYFTLVHASNTYMPQNPHIHTLPCTL